MVYIDERLTRTNTQMRDRSGIGVTRQGNYTLDR